MSHSLRDCCCEQRTSGTVLWPWCSHPCLRRRPSCAAKPPLRRSPDCQCPSQAQAQAPVPPQNTVDTDFPWKPSAQNQISVHPLPHEYDLTDPLSRPAFSRSLPGDLRSLPSLFLKPLCAVPFPAPRACSDTPHTDRSSVPIPQSFPTRLSCQALRRQYCLLPALSALPVPGYRFPSSQTNATACKASGGSADKSRPHPEPPHIPSSSFHREKSCRRKAFPDSFSSPAVCKDQAFFLSHGNFSLPGRRPGKAFPPLPVRRQALPW